MAKLTKFQTLRRRLAGVILGEQFALFMPTGKAEQPMMSYTDEELGQLTRYWFHTLEEMVEKISLEKGVPYEHFFMQTSIVAWAKKMIRMNSDEMTMTINNFDGGDGSLSGNWQVSVRKLSDDYEYGEDGTTQYVDDNGNIVRYVVNWKHPNSNPLHGKMAGNA